MKINTFIRTAALLIVTAVATPAFAGGVTVAEDNGSKLKIGAKFFLNSTDYKVQKNNLTTLKTRSLAVDRAYFTAKYYFDSDWMMRITTDINNEPALGKNNNVFLKYAYVEGKLIDKALTLRLGQSHTPWIDYEQGLWKHRYVSKVLIDTNKYDNSSDLGIGFKGKLADGLVGYWVTATNGQGYSNASNNKTDSNGIDFDGRLSVFPIEGMTVDFQYRNGYRGTKTTTAAGDKSILNQVMITYGSGHDYRIGANYVINTKTTNNVDVAKEDAYAVWGWTKVGGGLGAFARYEYTKDQLTANALNPQIKKRYVAGLEYSPRKHVTFSLAYDKLDITDVKSVAGQTEQKTRYGLYSEVKF